MALALALPAAPLLAQSADDAQLKALIPDAAVANPEAWAKAPAPDSSPNPAPDSTPGPGLNPSLAAAPPAVVVNPATPLPDVPGITIAWPTLDVPAMPDLAPELAGDGPGAGGQPLPSLDTLTLPKPTGARANRHDPLAGGRIVLAWDGDPAAERAEIETRFRQLSTMATLPLRGSENVAQLGVRGASDRALLERLMHIYGYYDADVTQALVTPEAPANGAAPPPRIRFDITPGVRYRFGAVALPGLEAAGDDAPRLRHGFALASGDAVNSDAIVAQAANLDTALGESGYAFATVGAPALTIDHARAEGDLTLPVDSGGRYVFGAITSSRPRWLSARHLAKMARFKRGKIYQRSQVDDLRRAILATGLVSSLTVAPRAAAQPAGAAPAAPGIADLDVTMTPAPPRTIAGAIGYDTAEGFRLEASWEHRNLFPPEGSLRLRGVAGTNEQLAGVTFRRNNIGGRDQVLTLDLYAQNANLTAFAARKVAFAATYERLTTLLFQKPWSWSLGAIAEASDEREGAPLGTAVITCPQGDGVASGFACLPARQLYVTGALPLRAAYDGSDSMLDPHRGWRGSLRISPEVAFSQGRTSPYVNIEGDASAYLPLSGNVVLAGRARLGAILGTGLDNIAPSRRLYAGGGGSVRGYGYDMVGPRNAEGEPEGGRSVYELSGEARIRTPWFGGALSLAPFLDAGGAETTARPNFAGLRFGAGLGLRYDSGIGPIRVDIGTPLDPHTGDSRIGVYVSLGQAF